MFRSRLAAVPEISEYQVTQTASGAHIAAVTTDHIDTAAVAAAVAAELGRVGLANPAVDVNTVDAIARHAETGKLRRFIGLATHPQVQG